MSSAKNHRIRSRKSYKHSAHTAEQFQQKQVMKATSKKAMQEKSSFFTTFMGLLKKGER